VLTMTPKRATAVVFGTAMFMSIMDTQIVNVALATISRQFHEPTSSTQWVVISYVLSLAVCIPASGWLGDRFGTKRIFLLAIVIFTLASALCAASTSLLMLVGMRVLQGVGGGMLTPVGMAMMYRAYPPAERVRVARTVTRVMVIAPATAPLIGGVLISALSWRWIFVVNLPVGAAALVFAARYLEEYRQETSGGYDLGGLVLGGPGLALVLYAVSEGPIAGWGAARVWITALAGVVLLASFVRLETSRRHPMLDLRMLGRNPLFRRSCAVQMCLPAAFFGSLVFISLYVQETRGYSALISGTTTFPEAVAIGLSSQLVARLYPRVGPRRLIAFGFAILAIACALLAQVSDSTSLWLIRLLTFVLGIGVSYVNLPVQAAAYAQISSAETGHATAIFQTCQRASQACAVAILSTVLAVKAGTSIHPPADAFHAVYLTGGGFAVLGVLLAFRIKDADAAETMVRRRAPKEELTPA
jgi:EmrB/QacA subfamily drug resistance transporter